MSRLIYVATTGDDLDGDGSPDHPFLTEDRAELDAEVGDVILIFEHQHPVAVPGGPLPEPGDFGPAPRSIRRGRRLNWLAITTGLVGLLTGVMLHHNASLAVFVVCVVAIITLAVLDD